MDLKTTFLSIPDSTNIFEVFTHNDDTHNYLLKHCKHLGIKNENEYIFMTDQLSRTIKHDPILNTCLDILKHNLYLPYFKDKIEISHVINLIHQTQITDTSNKLVKNKKNITRDIFDINGYSAIIMRYHTTILSIFYETYMYHELYTRSVYNNEDDNFYEDFTLYESETEQFIDILISSNDNKLDIIHKNRSSLLELFEDITEITPYLKNDNKIITTSDLIDGISYNTASLDFTENIIIQINNEIFELIPLSPLF